MLQIDIASSYRFNRRTVSEPASCVESLVFISRAG